MTNLADIFRAVATVPSFGDLKSLTENSPPPILITSTSFGVSAFSKAPALYAAIHSSKVAAFSSDTPPNNNPNINDFSCLLPYVI